MNENPNIPDDGEPFYRALSQWERERMEREALQSWGTHHPAYRDKIRSIVLAELEAAYGADLTRVLAELHAGARR
jgi:hypothetical protein